MCISRPLICLEPGSSLGEEEEFGFVNRRCSRAAFIQKKSADRSEKDGHLGSDTLLRGEDSQALPICPSDKSVVEQNAGFV